MTAPADATRKLVLDVRAKAQIWRVTADAERAIASAAPPGWSVSVVPTDTVSDGDGGVPPTPEALAAIRDAEVYFGFGITRPLFDAARSLRWVHSAAAGVTNVLFDEMRTSDIVLTNSAGVHAIPMAEYVVAGLLHFWRGFDRTEVAQRSAHWARPEFVSVDTPVREIGGSNVVIVGTGGIGTEAATRLSALGAVCVGIRRRVDAYQPAGFARIVGLDALERELPTADALVLAAPLTPETRGIMGPERLDLLPRHAVIVNVSRGALVDEAALAARLAAGRLRGAALDVFASEPLAPESPLWHLRNALVTPHISAATPHRFWERETELFLDNWRRYVAGSPLRNTVNKDAGY